MRIFRGELKKWYRNGRYYRQMRFRLEKDYQIWRFAKENKYDILTFDEDFSELQNLFSFPPKVIWLRTGNVSTKEISDRLVFLEQEIINFRDNREVGIYEIYI